jgi:hypothetical protein
MSSNPKDLVLNTVIDPMVCPLLPTTIIPSDNALIPFPFRQQFSLNVVQEGYGWGTTVDGTTYANILHIYETNSPVDLNVCVCTDIVTIYTQSGICTYIYNKCGLNTSVSNAMSVYGSFQNGSNGTNVQVTTSWSQEANGNYLMTFVFHNMDTM